MQILVCEFSLLLQVTVVHSCSSEQFAFGSCSSKYDILYFLTALRKTSVKFKILRFTPVDAAVFKASSGRLKKAMTS